MSLNARSVVGKRLAKTDGIDMDGPLNMLMLAKRIERRKKRGAETKTVHFDLRAERSAIAVDVPCRHLIRLRCC